MNEAYLSYFQGRRVLVTGGLGFIGTNLCLRLLDLGAEVTVMGHFVPPDPYGGLALMRPRLHVVVADIRDKGKVAQAVEGQEVIFSLAGKSGAADSNRAPQDDLDINCRGHMTLLETCRSINPRVTIVFPSSRLVYGKPRYLPVDERHPLAPESIYAADKLAVENYLLIFGMLYGMKVTVLRISNPYGPMQPKRTHGYGIANKFIQAAVAGEKITIFGNGEQRRDYLYIDDLIDALLRSAWSEEARSKIYNIGCREGTSLLELAELAIAEAGSGEIVRAPWPEDYRIIETGDYWSEITLAERELGWRPLTGVRAGITWSVAFYQRYGPDCRHESLFLDSQQTGASTPVKSSGADTNLGEH
jgi:UDP-glucose 4-epimerase